MTQEIPLDIYRSIIEIIAKKKEYKTLQYLATSFKLLHDLIDDSIWKLAWDGKDDKTYLSYKARVLLYGLTGCQFCKKPRIRKIYEDFDVRCCKECLYERTICDYKLKKEFEIGPGMLKNLSYMEVNMYKSKIGNYTLKFYWIEDIEKKLGKTLGQIKSDLNFAYLKKIEEKLQEKLQKAPSGFDLNYIIANTPGYYTSDPRELKADQIYKHAFNEFKYSYYKNQFDHHQMRKKHVFETIVKKLRSIRPFTKAELQLMQ